MRLLLAVFFLTVCSVLRAADPAGTIAGSIQDPTGSTVANARIAATSTTTGLTRQVTSGADGSYVLPLLPVGVSTSQWKRKVSKAWNSGALKCGPTKTVGRHQSATRQRYAIGHRRIECADGGDALRRAERSDTHSAALWSCP